MRYVPVLKVRTAEMGALDVTPAEQLRPLLELVPLPLLKPDEDPEDTKTLDEQLLNQLKLIGESWGSEPVMIYFGYVIRYNSDTTSSIKNFID